MELKLLDHYPHPSYVISASGEIVQGNPAFYNLLAADQDEIPLLMGKPLANAFDPAFPLDIVLPEQPSPLPYSQVLKACISQQEYLSDVVEIHFEALHRSWKGCIEISAAGHYAWVVFRDLKTYQKRDDNSKKESIDAAFNEALLKFNADGSLGFINAKGLSLLDQEEGAILGKSPFQSDWPVTDGPFWNDALEEVMKSSKTVVRSFKISEDETMNWTFVPILNKAGAIEEVIAAGHDGSDLQSVREALTISESKLSNFTNALPDVLIEMDKDFRFSYVNNRATEILGLSLKDFIGKRLEDIPIRKEIWEEWKEGLYEVLESKQELRHVLTISKNMVLELFSVPQFDPHGNVASMVISARDITESQRTREELARSKNTLMDAMKMANISTWSFDTVSLEIDMNPEFCALLDIPYDPEKEIRMKSTEFFDRFVHPDDKKHIKELFQTLIKLHPDNDRINAFQYRLITAEGKQKNVSVSTRIERDKNLKITRLFGTNQDITLFKKTEQELERYKKNLEKLVEIRTDELKLSRAKLEDALKLAKLGTWEYDFSMECFIVGEEVLNMLGTSSKIEGGHIISNKRFNELVHPEDWEVYYESAMRALQAENDNYLDNVEYRVVRPDGSIRNFYISIKIIRDAMGRQLKHYGTIQDVTEIKKIQQERTRLTSILEATSDIVGITNTKGKIQYLNQTGLRYFEISDPSHLMDMDASDIFSEEFFQEIMEVGMPFALSKGVWDGEGHVQKKGHPPVPVSLALICHKDNLNRVECFSAIIRDISDQKKTEQDLLFKNNELDTFVYRASHDLRGPISSLLGLRTIVNYEVHDPGALEFFAMYHQQVEKLNDIVLSLIELTKIKEREIRKSPINFNRLIEECIYSFSKYKHFNKIRFHKEVKVSDGYLSDLSFIKTILFNLIENSIKFSKARNEGNVSIKVYDEEKEKLIIEIRDNGIGIEKNIQDKVFNMFFKADEANMGPGLGLYILKNTVEKLEGSIHMQSIPGKETLFKITLPFTKEGQAAPHQPLN